jgi:hypothetical protein
MPNGKVAICPFEIAHGRKHIMCEGCGEYERTIHEFESQHACDAWYRNWCSTRCYQGCPYYLAITEYKYPEEMNKNTNDEEI